MKKKVGLVLAGVLICGLAFGAVNTDWVDLDGIHSNNNINVKVGDEYYPIQFYLDGTATSSDGGQRAVRSVLNLGTPQAEPFNLKTLAGQKEWYQALPAVLQPVAKDLRMQATNEDVSN